jgi:hypothetical protein
MSPQDVLKAIVRALKQSSAFSGGDYVTHEIDPEGPDNRLEQPFVSLQPVSAIRADQYNTDLVGYTTDDAGNRTGRIFEAIFEMDVQADIWIAVGNTQLDATALGADLQQALYPYDSQMAAQPFPDGDGGTVGDLSHFLLGEGRRQDDLAGPGVRRWRQDLSARFVDRVTPDDGTADYIETVDSPSAGDLTDGSDDGVAIEYNP